MLGGSEASPLPGMRWWRCDEAGAVVVTGHCRTGDNFSPKPCQVQFPPQRWCSQQHTSAVAPRRTGDDALDQPPTKPHTLNWGRPTENAGCEGRAMDGARKVARYCFDRTCAAAPVRPQRGTRDSRRTGAKDR